VWVMVGVELWDGVIELVNVADPERVSERVPVRVLDGDGLLVGLHESVIEDDGDGVEVGVEVSVIRVVLVDEVVGLGDELMVGVVVNEEVTVDVSVELGVRVFEFEMDGV
jgi:hypothetical protein